MRVIIVGAGEVGTHLAKLLSEEEMEISLLDESRERLGFLDADYDMLTKVGSPTSIHDLQDIGVKNVDLFIAVTPVETENITSCLIANQLGAKRTLARIDNYEYLLPGNKGLFEQMGLNHLIYPEVLAANEIEESLRTNWMRFHLSLCHGAMELCVVKVREGAAVVNKTFSSGIYNHGRFRIVAIKRESDTIIPRGNDQVLAGDVVYVVCNREEMDFLREQLGKHQGEIRNIIFFGGSRITRKAALALPEDLNIKVLEKDREVCTQLSEKLPHALIINADGSDMSVLKEEGIQDADAFVAVTDSSEANIFACLAAKRFGVGKTIAEVENIDYIPMAEALDIGTVLNKKTIAASYIYQMLLDTSVLNIHNLTSADAEIVVFIAKEGSRITRGKVRDMELPEDTNIGAIVRAGEGVLVNGETRIIANDQVVVFCKKHVLRRLEHFFK